MANERGQTTVLDFLDFELEIGKGSGRSYPVEVIRSVAGEAQEIMRFPFNDITLENQLLTLQNVLLRSGGTHRRIPSVEEKSVQHFGQSLFNALFTGEVRSRYAVSQREAIAREKGLRLKLRIQSATLAALPWEFLYDSGQGEYVCLSRNTPIVRYIELPLSPQPLEVTLPLRMLGMIANPQDLADLDVELERQRVEAAIEHLLTRGLVQLTWLPGQTWQDLLRAMRLGPWHIFHFIGHGGFDSRADEGLIALNNDQGQAVYLTATQVALLLTDHRSLRLVVLNACEGARGGKRDIFSSTAATLVRRGIPAVLAMQYEITDRAAIELSRAFYEAIADGMPVDAAVGEARKAISLSIANSMEWGTPVLYMHSPDGVLFRLSQQTDLSSDQYTTLADDRKSDLPVPELSTHDSAQQVITPEHTAPSTLIQTSPSGQVSTIPMPSPQSGISRRTVLMGLVGLGVVGAVVGGSIALPKILHPTSSTPTPTPTSPPPTTTTTSSSNTAMFGFDLQHTHYNPSERALNTTNVSRLRLLWATPLGGIIGLSSPVVANGVVYIGSFDHKLYALNSSSGNILWTANTDDMIWSSPAVANGIVYIGSGDFKVYAFNATTGKQIWNVKTDNSVSSSASVVNGIVYIGSGDSYVYALDASSGSQIWRAATGSGINSSPAVVDGIVYIGSYDGNLYALDASRGRQIWKVATDGKIWDSPAVANGIVYIGTQQSFTVYAINASTGKIRWQVKTGGDINSSPAVVEGIIYVGSKDDNLYALDAFTGRLIWKGISVPGAEIASSPMVANRVLYVGSWDHKVYALDFLSGNTLWSYTTGFGIESSPVVVNGVVYIGSRDQNLYAFALPGSRA